MPTIKDTKLLSGKGITFGGSIDIFRADTGGIQLDPKFYEGSFTYFAGEMLYSNGNEWLTTDPPIIRTPTSLTPTSSIHNRQLRLSPFSTTITSNDKPTQTGIIFEISLNKTMADFVSIQVASTNSTTYNLSTQQYINGVLLTPGTKYYWRAKYTANYGGAVESGYSKVRDQTYPDYIAKPAITTPANTITSILAIGSFSTPYTVEANSSSFTANNITTTINSTGYKGIIARASTEWEVYTTNDLTALTIPGSTDFKQEFRLGKYLNVDPEKFNTIDTLEVFGTDIIPNSTTYYWRVRYNGFDSGYLTDLGIGEIFGGWSDLQTNKQVAAIVSPHYFGYPIAWDGNQLFTALQITDYQSAQTPKVPVASTVWEIFSSTSTASLVYTYSTNGFSTVSTNEFTKVQQGNTTGLNTEVTYYWRAKYTNQNAVESEYTSIIPLPFKIAAFIDTPTPVTTEQTTTTLDISKYYSRAGKYYLRTDWRFYESNAQGNGATGNPIVSLSTTDKTYSYRSMPLLTLGELTPGKKYFWEARYVGNSFGDLTDLYYSKYSFPQRSFIQQFNLIKPVINAYTDSTLSRNTITGNSISADIYGPSVTFECSPITISPGGRQEQLVETDWELQLQDTVDINTWIPIEQYVNKDTVYENLTIWNSTKSSENGKFRVRVTHIGSSTPSEPSDWVYFSTAKEYKNALSTTPPYYDIENGTQSLVIGTYYSKDETNTNNFGGGYYSSDMWGYICETQPTKITIPDSIKASTIAGHNQSIWIPLGSGVTFKNRKAQIIADTRYHFDFTITNDLGEIHFQNLPNVKGKNGPLFYIGQVVDIRNKANPYEKMQGHIIRAYGSAIRVAVYSSELGSNYNSSQSTNTSIWCIMGKYRIFVSDYARGGEVYADNDFLFEGSYYNQYRPCPAIPFEAYSYTEGYRITNAIFNAFEDKPYSEWYKSGYNNSYITRLVYNYNQQSPGGFSDWYAPSRDELTLMLYYYANSDVVNNVNLTRPLTTQTNISGTKTSYYGGGSYDTNGVSKPHLYYASYGAFPDKSDDWVGNNRNSVVPLNELQLDKNTASRIAQVKVSNLPSQPNYNITPTNQKMNANYYYAITLIKGSDWIPDYTPPVNKTDYLLNPVYPDGSPVVGSPNTAQDSVISPRCYGSTSSPFGNRIVDSTYNGNTRLIRRELY